MMSTTPPALDMKSILADRSNRVVVCCLCPYLNYYIIIL